MLRSAWPKQTCTPAFPSARRRARQPTPWPDAGVEGFLVFVMPQFSWRFLNYGRISQQHPRAANQVPGIDCNLPEQSVDGVSGSQLLVSLCACRNRQMPWPTVSPPRWPPASACSRECLEVEGEVVQGERGALLVVRLERRGLARGPRVGGAGIGVVLAQPERLLGRHAGGTRAGRRSPSARRRSPRPRAPPRRTPRTCRPGCRARRARRRSR